MLLYKRESNDFMIKKGNDHKKNVDSATRVKLIRKGNEFFSNGQILSAEKIFITVDYKDGLVRLGDYYLGNKNLEKSAEMYFMSENESKIESFCKIAAKAIRNMISEEDGNKAVYDKIIIENNMEITK
jgi:hypothetical protein